LKDLPCKEYQAHKGLAYPMHNASLNSTANMPFFFYTTNLKMDPEEGPYKEGPSPSQSASPLQAILPLRQLQFVIKARQQIVSLLFRVLCLSLCLPLLFLIKALRGAHHTLLELMHASPTDDAHRTLVETMHASSSQTRTHNCIPLKVWCTPPAAPLLEWRQRLPQRWQSYQHLSVRIPRRTDHPAASEGPLFGSRPGGREKSRGTERGVEMLCRSRAWSEVLSGYTCRFKRVGQESGSAGSAKCLNLYLCIFSCTILRITLLRCLRTRMSKEERNKLHYV